MRRLSALMGLAAVILLAPAAEADTRRLVLKNGAEHYGEITVQAQVVHIETVGGERLSFPRSEVAGYQVLSGAQGKETGALTPLGPAPEAPAAPPTEASPTAQVPTAATSVDPWPSALDDAPLEYRAPWYLRSEVVVGLALGAIVVFGGLVAVNRRGRGGGVLTGCLWILGILAALAVAAGLFVYFQWRSWTGDGARKVADEVLAQADLPDIDKARIRQKVERVIDDFEAERIGAAELERLGATFARGPLLPLTLQRTARETYLKVQGLDADERVAGERALERWARGLAEGRIPYDAGWRVFEPVSTRGADGKTRLKTAAEVRVGEVRTLLKGALDAANAAQIPDEPWRVDVAQVVIDTIEKATAPKK